MISDLWLFITYSARDATGGLAPPERWSAATEIATAQRRALREKKGRILPSFRSTRAHGCCLLAILQKTTAPVGQAHRWPVGPGYRTAVTRNSTINNRQSSIMLRSLLSLLLVAFLACPAAGDEILVYPDGPLNPRVPAIPPQEEGSRGHCLPISEEGDYLLQPYIQFPGVRGVFPGVRGVRP